MERVAMLALPMCALLLLSLQFGAQGARMPSARVQGQLPPCKDVPGGIRGWDCYDPPQHPLPPCDFKHQSPFIDCWPKGTPPAADVTDLIQATSTTPAAASDAQHARVQGQLPPCKDVPGGIPGWDCFDPPTHPLPPCDFRHQRAGFDCWPPSPAALKATAVTDDSAAVGASTYAVQTTTPRKSNAYGVQAMLPPCTDVPGGIPGWDCFDPPTTPSRRATSVTSERASTAGLATRQLLVHEQFRAAPVTLLCSSLSSESGRHSVVTGAGFTSWVELSRADTTSHMQPSLVLVVLAG